MTCDSHVLLCQDCAPAGAYEEPSIGIISGTCEWCGKRIGIEPPAGGFRFGIGKWKRIKATIPKGPPPPDDRDHRLVPVELAKAEAKRRGIEFKRRSK